MITIFIVIIIINIIILIIFIVIIIIIIIIAIITAHANIFYLLLICIAITKNFSNTKVVLCQDARLGLVELACEGDTRAISVLLDEQADVNLCDQVLASLSAFLTFTLSALS